MSWHSFKFEKADRSLLERLFEPPAIGRMSPAATLLAYGLLIFWSAFVIFPIYWVVITAFKDAAAVNQGPYFIPFVDFQPNLDAWRVHLSADPYCDWYAIGRQFVLLVHNSLAFLLSPFVRIAPMEPQICKLYLAFTNSLVISIVSTALCISVGSMAAYALARVQYKPKFGNIIVFVILTLIVIVTTSYVGLPWYVTSAIALALFFFLARALGKRFTTSLGNNDILFWMISQRVLPPIVVMIPVYMMFQAVGLLDTHLALIIIYAVTNLPIVVWLMHDFFANLPMELEESAQLDGATRFGIFWEIVLPLTRPGLAATTLLTLILNWNEYLFAVFLSTAKAQTMPIMVAAKNAGEKGILWWEMCAIIVVMIIPVILMAILLTRFIARGVLLGAVKG
ncbi:MAG TPA: carbohydrate ABC transporter permease [Aestuariivirgaceae bacterium]|jgi:multiple sugar transport system permease protein